MRNLLPLKIGITVILVFFVMAGCAPNQVAPASTAPAISKPMATTLFTNTAPIAEITVAATTSPTPLEKIVIGRRYSFPNLSSNLNIINATTQTLFLSTFPLPDSASGEPVETALIGMRYGRTYSFPQASFGTTYVLRDAGGLVIAVYAVTAAPQQVLHVTNLSLLAARAAKPVKKLNTLRSFWSGTARKVALHFVNSSDSEILVYWVDFAGNEELKVVLLKGQRVKVESRYGNTWALRTQSGQPIMSYYVTEAKSQVVDIPEKIIAGLQLRQE